jgi:hypothetical protein
VSDLELIGDVEQSLIGLYRFISTSRAHLTTTFQNHRSVTQVHAHCLKDLTAVSVMYQTHDAASQRTETQHARRIQHVAAAAEANLKYGTLLQFAKFKYDLYLSTDRNWSPG